MNEFLDINEAVDFTGYTKKYIYKMCHYKEIPHYKRRGKLFFKKSELKEWLSLEKVEVNKKGG